MKDMIRARFDEVLGRHFERLIRTRQGIGGMPLNLATIGCIVLLGGREIEIGNSASDEPKRHTRDTLLKEAADLGIGPDEFLETALQDMIQRGYCEVDPEDRFLSRQPTLTMTRLLDRIFPRMPGINFLALIGQTMEEAVTGRTDLEAAISRFDQTLTHYGVPFSKEKTANTDTASSGGSARKSDADQQKVHVNREQILSELYSRNKTSREPSRPSLRVLSGRSVPGQAEIKEISPQKESPHDIEERKEEPAAEDVFNATDHELPEEARINTTAAETVSTSPEVSALISDEETQAVSYDAVADNVETASIPEQEENPPPIEEICPEETTTTDDAIADKIAAFEKDLALICPICRISTLKEQTTAAGKIYYTCPSESCNFISWGKPHHTECRRCKNPFLVEVNDISGKTILKCPRATCQYRQDLNPPKKLVRKRLVRRRK